MHDYVLIQRDEKVEEGSIITTLDVRPSAYATVLATGPDVKSVKQGDRIHLAVILGAPKYTHDGIPNCELVHEHLIDCALTDI